MKLEAYLLTVAVQAGIISLCCLLVTLCIRQARWRAGFALTALLASALLPWIVLPLEPRPAVAIPAAVGRAAASPVSPGALPNFSVTLDPPEEGQAFVETARREYPPAAYRLRTAHLLLVLWMTGAVAGLGVVLLAMLRCRRWSRAMEKPDNEEWAAILNACPQAGPRDGFRLAPESTGPALAGFIRPRIILPRILLDPARRTELAWALRHELSHREGHDSRWALAAQIIRAAFWWNPIVHLFHRMWANAREQVCDRAAAVSAEERCAYGHFLVSLAARHLAGSIAMAAASKRRLGRRIASLLDAPEGPLRRPSYLHKTLAWGFTLLALFVASRFGFVPRAAGEAASVAEATQLEQILHPEKMMVVSMGVLVSPGNFAENGQIFDAAGLADRIRVHTEEIAHIREASPDAVPRLRVSVVPGPLCAGPLGNTFWTNLSDFSFPSSVEPVGPWDENWPGDHFRGWLASHSYRRVGEKFEVSLHAVYSFVPGHHPAPCYVLPGNPAEKMVETKGVGQLASGQAIVFSFGEVEAGVHVSLILGLLAVDPWDQQVAIEEKHFAALSPSPPVPLVKMDPNVTTVDYWGEMHGDPKLVEELQKKREIARDQHPANKDLMIQREIQRKILQENPEDGAAAWRYQELVKAIKRNAANDPAVEKLDEELRKLTVQVRQADGGEDLLQILLGKGEGGQSSDFKEGTIKFLAPLPGRETKNEPTWGYDHEDPEHKLRRLREEWDYERRRDQW